MSNAKIPLRIRNARAAIILAKRDLDRVAAYVKASEVAKSQGQPTDPREDERMTELFKQANKQIAKADLVIAAWEKEKESKRAVKPLTELGGDESSVAQQSSDRELSNSLAMLRDFHKAGVISEEEFTQRQNEITAEQVRRNYPCVSRVCGDTFDGWAGAFYVDEKGKHHQMPLPAAYIPLPDTPLRELAECFRDTCLCHQLVQSRDAARALGTYWKPGAPFRGYCYDFIGKKMILVPPHPASRIWDFKEDCAISGKEYFERYPEEFATPAVKEVA